MPAPPIEKRSRGAVQSTAATIAGLTRAYGPAHPSVTEARVRLREAKAEAHVRRIIEAAPPLSAEVRAKLAAILLEDERNGGRAA